jgi:transposase
MDWAKSPEVRDQMLLFPRRLDDAIGQDHQVRLLDDILGRLDWSKWESAYNLRRGQPPIHPRVVAGVILYGLLTRIRTSRALEESLQVRLDFRWLVEGRSIDHTTISEFRRKNTVALKDIFVQIGLVAREMGWLPLETLAFDGTRLRANNRQTGTRTPERLRELKTELTAKFEKLEAETANADRQEDEVFGNGSAHTVGEELANVKGRLKQVEAALAEIKRIEQAGETMPKRMPITDPESRMLPNKEGGYAPNYTPLATVDVDSGLIVSADVIANTDEDKHLIEAIEDDQEQFGLETPPGEVLADGMMSSGDNLAECDARGISLYSPLRKQKGEENPALRDDPTRRVPPEDRDRLPVKNVTCDGEKQEQLDKQAFVYDEENNCYWCPEGKQLPYESTTTEAPRGRRRERSRFKAAADDCAVCPLREKCLSGTAERRSITHEQHESLRVAHGKKMLTDEAKEKYSRRCHPGERPFAMIKHHFGARRFLLRGLDQVRQEWLWLVSAFNLHRLFGLIHSGADPPPAPT